MSFSKLFLKDDISSPAEGELEVSIFGAGVGECILVHLATGKWIIVDSFLYRDSGQPVALEYLSSIGVDVSTQVRQVVVTHWHDDHIKGSSTVFKACTSADMVCSNALNSKEFFQLLTLQRSHSSILTSITTGIDEFREIMQLVLDRKKNSGKLPLQFATSCKTIFTHSSSSTSARVVSLSPSDAEFYRALIGFEGLFPAKVGEAKKRLVDLKPNDTAVVLWIEIDNLMVLLGSDLENCAAEDSGWKNIVTSLNRPTGRAIVFKIPHHGSVTGYEERVWQEMLTKNPHAILTPFTRSNLPREGEVMRILSHTTNAYSAADGSSKKVKRESIVDKVLKERTITRKTLDGKLGLVRLRFDIKTQSIREQLFGTACHLSRLAASLPSSAAVTAPASL